MCRFGYQNTIPPVLLCFVKKLVGNRFDTFKRIVFSEIHDAAAKRNRNLDYCAVGILHFN